MPGQVFFKGLFMLCSLLRSIPGLHPVDVSSIPIQFVTTTDISVPREWVNGSPLKMTKKLLSTVV